MKERQHGPVFIQTTGCHTGSQIQAVTLHGAVEDLGAKAGSEAVIGPPLGLIGKVCTVLSSHSVAVGLVCACRSCTIQASTKLPIVSSALK